MSNILSLNYETLDVLFTLPLKISNVSKQTT